MHRKTQLFVTREALAALARDQRTQEAIANLVSSILPPRVIRVGVRAEW